MDTEPEWLCTRAETALCPRRLHRDLSPPSRPPEAETYPPNASMNVFLVDSRNSAQESWRFCFHSAPQAAKIPSRSLVIYCECVILPRPPPIFS